MSGRGHEWQEFTDCCIFCSVNSNFPESDKDCSCIDRFVEEGVWIDITESAKDKIRKAMSAAYNQTTKWEDRYNAVFIYWGGTWRVNNRSIMRMAPGKGYRARIG